MLGGRSPAWLCALATALWLTGVPRPAPPSWCPVPMIASLACHGPARRALRKRLPTSWPAQSRGRCAKATEEEQEADEGAHAQRGPSPGQSPGACRCHNGRRYARNGKPRSPRLLAPQTLGTSFLGAQFSESGYIPPDSKGAVGPTQVLVIANGRIKSFSKTGELGSLNVSTDAFFNSVRNGAGTTDPQIRYDRLSGRWFVVMITVGDSESGPARRQFAAHDHRHVELHLLPVPA